ncbi:hypothetical protein [Parasphingopyxis lamellibrachiae]|uniref:Uncharacterized protein n=1 Tax=Parasphingopyxis lamellibrachiae TaxID=680125 RepID=A0A3D9FGP3_9SPHN|nr:hypothetical protein [Parasphingopyxis lamellibrachiae]RED16959.1 hypothetical protein DFR46_1993 [Parasphingopyxis lamellibrachiae]
MIRFTPPVRFVASVLTLWIGLRIIFWTPADIPQRLLQMPNPFLPGLPALPAFGALSPDEAGGAPGAREPHQTTAPGARHAQPPTLYPKRVFAVARQPRGERCGARCTRMLLAANIPPLSQAMLMRFARRRSGIPPGSRLATQANPALPPAFSLSAWAQWRSGDGIGALADDGELGGSQAGIAARYRVWRGAGAEAALAARLSRPIDHGNGAEAAIGIALRPAERIPVELIAERRIGLDDGGRDAWSLGIAGGVYRQPLPLGFELDGYAQAGIVGARRRDFYGDAALVVSRPVPLSERSTLSIGGGVWAGAQPGASRVDIGPEASVRLPAGDGGIRLSLSWRERVAGFAAPGSGPVLALGADF